MQENMAKMDWIDGLPTRVNYLKYPQKPFVEHLVDKELAGSTTSCIFLTKEEYYGSFIVYSKLNRSNRN